MPELGPRGSLLVELAIDAPPAFALGDARFVRKVEHHLTVFGSTRGKLLQAAAAADPELRSSVERIALTFDFEVALTGAWLHLIEIESDGALETIVALASARIDDFFAAVRARVKVDDDAGAVFAESLASPPPPHVTVYTTHPAGHRGIGLKSRAELDSALATGRGAPLSARWIAAADTPSVRLER